MNKKALWWKAANPTGIPAKARTRVRARSTAMAKRMAGYRKQRDQFLDAHRTCQFPGCTKLASDIHHLRGRAGSLLLLTDFWKAVCRIHHDWIGMNPTGARRAGMLCEVGQWNTHPAA